jgi:recombination protein RecA
MKQKQEKTEAPVPSSKADALRIAMDSLSKKYGEGSIMILGKGPIKKTPAQSTGCLSLDAAIGIGGLPKGRVIEVYGPESAGKTLMALTVVAEAQKCGGTAAFIDVEHALDISYAAQIGVDVSKLLISQPDYGEQALEIVEALVLSNAVDIVVVDSVAALTPRAEIEGDMGDAQMGAQARLMSQALRKLTAAVSKSNTILIFINQLRMKIGVMFGNPETTTGGNALKFYASVRLDVRKIEAIKVGDKHVGNRVKIKIVKNKVAPPFRETVVDLIFGEGIDKVSDIIDLAVAHNIVVKSGSWFSYKEEKLGHGKDGVKEFFKQLPEIFEELKKQVAAVVLK